MSLSRSLMYYFQVRSLNSSHQTLHFSALEFFCFFQRTQISLNRFYQFLEVFSCAFFFSFSKFAFSFFLFLSEDADLPEFSFTFFDWRVVSQRPQESTREGVLVKCYYLPIYFSSQIKYHILWIFVVYTQ